MERKYEFTGKTMDWQGKTLHQIRATRSFNDDVAHDNDVQQGDLGGWIEKEENLSHEGNCWVWHDAKVYGNAKVCDNAMICGNAQVYENAVVSGDALIWDDAQVYGNAQIYEYVRILSNAKVHGSSIVGKHSFITGNAEIFGRAIINGDVTISDDVKVFDTVGIFGNARIYDNAKIYGSATIDGLNSEICIEGNVEICDNAKVYGRSNIKENAKICQDQTVRDADCIVDLSSNLEESIRCQTGLIPINGKVIAYKQVKRDLSSYYDSEFYYEIGEWVEVEDAETSNRSCATGLHFSNANYWNRSVGADTAYLIAEINLKDIITVQQGKIRCKKAFILGRYDIKK